MFSRGHSFFSGSKCSYLGKKITKTSFSPKFPKVSFRFQLFWLCAYVDYHFPLSSLSKNFAERYNWELNHSIFKVKFTFKGQKRRLVQIKWSYQHFIFKITKIFIIDNKKYLSMVRFYIRMKESICRVYITVSRQWGRGESPQFASLWLWHFWFVNSRVRTDDLFLAAVPIGHPLHLFFF